MRRTLPPWAGDVALALVLSGATIAWVLLSRHASDGPDLVSLRFPGRVADAFPRGFKDGSASGAAPVETGVLLTNLVAVAPVAARRRWPLAAAVAAFGGVLAIHQELTWPGFIGLLVCAYSAVAYGHRLWLSLAVLGVAASIAAAKFTTSIPDMPGWLTPFAILAPVGLAAATIRSTRGRVTAAARRAEAAEREREAATRAALAEQRARIARELHDVVSHHVSVMLIQAGAAGKVLPDRPDLAGQALSAIEGSGRDAMAELRHLLGVLDPVDDTLHPQPGLRDIDALVASVTAAGQPVTLRREVDDLPGGLDLTVYRVVQEGLTNALRHAPGAPTAVAVRRDGGEVCVEVRNTAARAPAAGVPGTGTGLVGLAERVRLYGGELRTRRPVTGGFELRARLPVDEPARDAPAGVEAAAR